MKRWKSAILGLGLGLGVTFGAALDARADVRFEGDSWASEQPKVSVSLTNVTRAEALRKLADEAGWSLVMLAPADDKVELHIKSAPADQVLRALLSDGGAGSWVAKREGTILTLSRGGPATLDLDPLLGLPRPAANVPPAVPAVPPVPSAPEPAAKAVEKPAKQRDIEVMGNSRRIGKDEVVHDVTVMGGTVEIEGRLTGNLQVIGGDAHLLGSARIEGNASVTGGRMRIDDGAEIEGDLSVVGGVIEGSENAKVGGSIKLDPSEGENRASFVTRAGHAVSAGVRTAAFLFVLGAIFISLGGVRAESLRSSIADKPMRSVALGVVGLLGTLAALVLCAVTIIGIPIAALGLVAAIVLAFAGTTSALTVLGAMVFGHKNKNIYVHLAIGCALFMLLGLVPVAGGLFQVAVVMAGIGGVVATRAFGLFQRKGAPGAHPYRSSSV